MARAYDFTHLTEDADLIIDYGAEPGTYDVKVRVGGEIAESFDAVRADRLHKVCDSEHVTITKAKRPKRAKGFAIAPLTDGAQVVIDHGAEQGTYDIHIRVGDQIVDSHIGVPCHQVVETIDSEHVEVAKAKAPK